MPSRYVSRYRPYRFRPLQAFGHLVRSANQRLRPFGISPATATVAAVEGARNAFSNMRQRQRVKSGQGVTNQYDRALIYRSGSSSRHNRRKRASFSRFKKKVKAVLCKELGSRTVVFNHPITTNQTDTTKNGMYTAALYGCNSNVDTELSDLLDIATSENLNSGAQKTGKMIFRSAVLDITFQNTSFYGTPTAIPGGTVEVDVYEMVARRQFVNAAGTGLANMQAVFDAGQANCLAVGGAPLTTLLTIESIGVTPWDIPQALSEFGIKILSKRKYVLSQGQCATYQVRDHKIRTIDRQRINDSSNSGFNLPGWTRIVYFLYKLTPGDRLQTSAVAQLDIGTTRKYLYKKMEQEGDYGSKSTL